VCQVEALKRPSPGVEGQIGVNEVSARDAGSPLSRMPPRTEGGLQPTRQPLRTVCRPLGNFNNSIGVECCRRDFIGKAFI